MNRRQALTGIAATAAVVTLPAIPGIAKIPPIASPLLDYSRVAWVVGTGGDYNWCLIRAATEKEAKAEWLMDHYSFDGCEVNTEAPPEDCECDYCCHLHYLDANRMQQWDTLPRMPTNADWLLAGMGCLCDKCSEETSSGGGAKIVQCDGSDPLALRHETVLCEDCYLEDQDPLQI